MNFERIEPGKAITRLFLFMAECGYPGIHNQAMYSSYESVEEAAAAFIEDVNSALSEVFNILYGRDYTWEERAWAHTLLLANIKFDEAEWKKSREVYLSSIDLTPIPKES